MKTNYVPVKLPVNVKTALAGESNHYRIIKEVDQVKLVTITGNKTQIKITHRMIKEDLIDESGTLTQTGEQVRDQLLINIEFAEHGIPHQYYISKHQKLEDVYRLLSGEPTVYTGTVGKIPFWSNGFILFVGEPPAKEYKVEHVKYCPFDIADYEQRRQAHPIGFTCDEPLSNGGRRKIWLYDGLFSAAIDSKYFDLINQQIENPVFALNKFSGEQNNDISLKPVLVYSNGKFAGLVMPIRVDSIPLYIKQMFNDNIQQMINEKFQEVPA